MNETISITYIIKANLLKNLNTKDYIYAFFLPLNLFSIRYIIPFASTVFTQRLNRFTLSISDIYVIDITYSSLTAHNLQNTQNLQYILKPMNSQNLYPLSFNPRGQQRYSRVQKQARYIPQFKNQNIQHTPLYRPQPLHDRHYQQPQPQRRHQDYRQLKTNLNPNDSAYLSNKSNYSISRREQSQKKVQDRKKQDIMRRVKQLQEKVLPMVERDHPQQEEILDSGWQSRIQLKLVRIQTCMDGLRKQWEVQMQKKIAQIDSMWQSRFQELVLRAEKTQ